jgi:hypothetical protein
MSADVCPLCANADCICEALSAAYAEGRRAARPETVEPNAIGWALIVAGAVVLGGLLTYWLTGGGQ